MNLPPAGLALRIPMPLPVPTPGIGGEAMESGGRDGSDRKSEEGAEETSGALKERRCEIKGAE